MAYWHEGGATDHLNPDGGFSHLGLQGRISAAAALAVAPGKKEPSQRRLAGTPIFLGPSGRIRTMLKGSSRSRGDCLSHEQVRFSNA